MKEQKIKNAYAIIDMYYYLIKGCFEIIDFTKVRRWNNEQERLEFIASEKWNIKKYLEEIKEQNDKLKTLIHV